MNGASLFREMAVQKSSHDLIGFPGFGQRWVVPEGMRQGLKYD
jgi:hypothetical protein